MIFAYLAARYEYNPVSKASGFPLCSGLFFLWLNMEALALAVNLLPRVS